MEKSDVIAVSEDTIPSETTHEEEAVNESAEGTPYPDTEFEAEKPSEGNGDITPGEEAEDSFHLPIVFNHEERTLTRDEAIKYAQLGMKLEHCGLDIGRAVPAMNKLDYLAAQQGSTAEELIDELYNAQEENYRESLKERFGEDEELIGGLMKAWKDRSRERYDKVIADRNAAMRLQAEKQKEGLEQRLADEYAELKTEIPELPSFAELPTEVKKMAADGKNLMTAYLLYQHRRAERVGNAERNAKQSSENSAGALGTAYGDSRSAAEEAFIRGIFGQ